MREKEKQLHGVKLLPIIKIGKPNGNMLKFFTQVFPKRLIQLSLLFCLTINTSVSHANGVSPYFAMNNDPLFDLEVERLVAITGMPVLTKPYHAKTILRYSKKIKRSHPVLYRRISNYINRYKRGRNITQAALKVSINSQKNAFSNNVGGQDSNRNVELSFQSFSQFNEHLIINAGGYINDKDGLVSNSYLSTGWDAFQVDIGYRQHWLSSLQKSALLYSTEAKPALSITASNVTPFTPWQIKYETSLAKLSTQQNIKTANGSTAGSPALLAMSLSIQPIDWWTLGINSTHIFGGNKKVTLANTFDAALSSFDDATCYPNDNFNTCDIITGNKQASIQNRFNFSVFNMPISLQVEYATESFAGDKTENNQNKAISYGVFLPYLTLPYLDQQQSLTIEYSQFDQAWFNHHIYQSGYRNKGVNLGHWWGQYQSNTTPAKGNSLDVEYTLLTKTSSQWRFNYSKAHYQAINRNQTLHQLGLTYTRPFKQYFIEFALKQNKTITDNSFIQFDSTIRY